MNDETRTLLRALAQLHSVLNSGKIKIVLDDVATNKMIELTKTIFSPILPKARRRSKKYLGTLNTIEIFKR